MEENIRDAFSKLKGENKVQFDAHTGRLLATSETAVKYIPLQYRIPAMVLRFLAWGFAILLILFTLFTRKTHAKHNGSWPEPGRR
jgi:hypothetical protein